MREDIFVNNTRYSKYIFIKTLIKLYEGRAGDCMHGAGRPFHIFIAILLSIEC